jgi:hypothetical protein
MREVVQNLVSTLLFSFQDLKLSTKDIIVVLKDTLNTTSSPLPIPNSHAKGVPFNTLERHSISLRVVDGVCDLVTSFSMVKIVGSPTFDFTFTYQKGVSLTYGFVTQQRHCGWPFSPQSFSLIFESGAQ